MIKNAIYDNWQYECSIKMKKKQAGHRVSYLQKPANETQKKKLAQKRWTSMTQDAVDHTMLEWPDNKWKNRAVG
jgi:hypothetical protein